MACERGRELGGCERPVCTVPTTGVVQPLLGDQRATCIGERQETLLVEAFVAEPTVDAFDEGVLIRLAGLYVVEGDGVRVRPDGEVAIDELRPVVAHDPCG